MTVGPKESTLLPPAVYLVPCVGIPLTSSVRLQNSICDMSELLGRANTDSPLLRW